MTATAFGQPGAHSVLASATPFVRRHLVPQRNPPTILGRLPKALYVELDCGTVIAVLTSDAVALPIGLILPTSARETPLDVDDLGVRVANGTLSLGSLTVMAAHERSARAESAGTPHPERIAEAVRALAPLLPRTTLLPEAIHALTVARSEDEVARAVRALIGRGPGLTPAGDDVLCGILSGGVLLDRDVGDLRRAVFVELARRPRATTSLSRQLLERAGDGEVIPEIAVLGGTLCQDTGAKLERALSGVLSIGHSSGVALAYGVVAAIELP